MIEFVSLVDGGAIVMYDSRGASLFDKWNRVSTQHAFLVVASDLCNVLGRVHVRHIVHKDLKPSNILLCGTEHDDDSLLRVELCDFGLSVLRPTLARRGVGGVAKLEGTLIYIAPEQTGRLAKTVDHRSDLYSLGVTFYELLAGEPPFRAATAEALITQHIDATPTPLLERASTRIPVCVALSAIVSKLMAKDPLHRYQSAFG